MTPPGRLGRVLGDSDVSTPHDPAALLREFDEPEVEKANGLEEEHPAIHSQEAAAQTPAGVDASQEATSPVRCYWASAPALQGARASQ